MNQGRKEIWYYVCLSIVGVATIIFIVATTYYCLNKKKLTEFHDNISIIELNR